MTPRRTARARWKDPRLLFGIVLVLTSVVVGARVVASFDDADEYWALAHDVRAGDPVTRDDLRIVSARLSDDTAFLAVDDELPARLEDLRWATDASGGVLVTADAWRHHSDARIVEIPVLVQVGSLPHDLVAGDVVDVWVAPSVADGETAAATLVLQSVRIGSVSDRTESLSGLGQTVILAAEDDEPDGADLALLTTGDVVLVRRP